VSIEVLTVHVQASLQALFSLNKEVQPSDEELPHFLLLKLSTSLIYCNRQEEPTKTLT
jgi:hypothetical protein